MTFAQFLEFLDGKKTQILSIVAALNSYAVATGVFTAEVGALVQTIASIMAGGVVVATNKVLGKQIGRKK